MPVTELAVDPFARIIGRSASLAAAIERGRKVAHLPYPIVLSGQTGTGKNILARAIHDVSQRRSEPFIDVLCSAIPADLLENELFGSKKGAYTSSIHDIHGRFTRAEGGTLFLDEISEIPMWLQAKLLGVFNRGEYWPVGSESPLQLNARVIVATNKNLSGQVASGKFREDLYYRLNVISIQMPSLKERQEDIPQLVEYFTEKFNEVTQRSVRLTREAVEKFTAQEWPGNVRQLENMLTRICALSSQENIDVKFVDKLLAEESINIMSWMDDLPVDLSMASVEKWHILKVLHANQGNVARTSRILGLGNKTLFNKLKRWGISADEFR